MYSILIKSIHFPHVLAIIDHLWWAPVKRSRLKLLINTAFLILVPVDLIAQSNVYTEKTKEGEKLLAAGKYTKSAKCYSDAFQSFGWKGFLPDRVNAARAWAMAGKLDSAYFNLFRVAEKLDYGNLEELGKDKYFQPLRSDERWPILYALVEKNSHSYRNKINTGERLFNIGQYAESAQCYSDAFQSIGWDGSTTDRLNAARAWAMAGILDSAYFQLFKIANHADDGKFDEENPNAYNYYWESLNSDKYLQALRSDERWQSLLDQAKVKMPTMMELAKKLETVLRADQFWRSKIDSINAQFGYNSVERINLGKFMQQQDSLNQIIVLGVLDTYGWLGKKAVGQVGSEAIFFVVQHASLPVQEKYLPMMREAVKDGNADGSLLALLEDRVLSRNGKKQLYGSQVTRDPATNEPHFCAIEDVDNVDQRRAGVGLKPLSEYAQHFGIIWDAAAIEKNKQMLPGLPEKK